MTRFRTFALLVVLLGCGVAAFAFLEPLRGEPELGFWWIVLMLWNMVPFLVFAVLGLARGGTAGTWTAGSVTLLVGSGLLLAIWNSLDADSLSAIAFLFIPFATLAAAFVAWFAGWAFGTSRS